MATERHGLGYRTVVTGAMQDIDASHGEGGGQVLRTALALSVAFGQPVTLRHIRERRPRPGLQPQHLTVVRALAAISEAEVVGDALDSTEVAFSPRTLRGGDYRFDIGAIRGSAGSVSLLLQALLLPLSLAADEAVDPLLEYLASGATVDDHLADQLLPFLALADTQSVFTCPRLSTHLRTVAWLVERMLAVRVTLQESRPARVEVSP